MDDAKAGDVIAVILMFASQTGKTEILNNIIAFFIDAEPSPTLMVQPTVEFAESWSKERLVPMIRDNPRLFSKVNDAKSRDSGNTILLKSFPGGSIAIVGANAPSGLAGRPRRVVALDEVDRYPVSAGTEGDPCALAIRRTESFWNAVVYMTSTPTTKGISKIEKEFDQTDKCYYFVPCHSCGELQTLVWAQLKWPEGKPEDAHYECAHCKAHWNDDQRKAAIQKGEWRPTAPFTGKRGYHLNGIYSPFRHKKGFKNRLHQMVADFLAAKAGGRETLKTWVNTFLAETWEDEAEKIEAHELAKRKEPYLPTLPEGVAVITCGVDVQKDRLALTVKGWGVGYESWGLLYREIPGDTLKPHVWADLDRLLLQSSWKKADGTEHRIAACCIDSGHATDEVLAFCKPRFGRRVWAVKGSSQRGQPLANANPTRGNRRRCPLYSIGTDTAKTMIFGRLKNVEPGPGYIHFPAGEYGFDDVYFKMLTAERQSQKIIQGKTVQVWVKTQGVRNEALDTEVYALAAVAILQPDFSRLIKPVAKPVESTTHEGDISDREQVPQEPPKVATPRRVPKPSRGSWLNGWRRL